MQIHLKQLEIEAALRQFISQQGINLTGKVVEIAFTSGRKDNGLSAEVTIEDGAGMSLERRSTSTQTKQPTDISNLPPPSSDTAQEPEAAPVKTTSLFSL